MWQYVRFFPKAEKYVSLFGVNGELASDAKSVRRYTPSHTRITPDTNNTLNFVVSFRRERIMELTRELAEAARSGPQVIGESMTAAPAAVVEIAKKSNAITRNPAQLVRAPKRTAPPPATIAPFSASSSCDSSDDDIGGSGTDDDASEASEHDGGGQRVDDDNEKGEGMAGGYSAMRGALQGENGSGVQKPASAKPSEVAPPIAAADDFFMNDDEDDDGSAGSGDAGSSYGARGAASGSRDASRFGAGASGGGRGRGRGYGGGGRGISFGRSGRGDRRPNSSYGESRALQHAQSRPWSAGGKSGSGGGSGRGRGDWGRGRGGGRTGGWGGRGNVPGAEDKGRG